MPPVVLDNISSCRSSPIHWNPTPVPAPAFDGFVPDLAVPEDLSWEYCIRILNNSGRSLPRSSGYPVFGSQRYKRSGIARNLASSISRATSPMASEFSTISPLFDGHPQLKRSATARQLNACSVSRATSPLPSEFSDFPTTTKDFEQHSKDFDQRSLDIDLAGSPGKNSGPGIMKKIFGQLAGAGKNRLSRSSSLSSSARRSAKKSGAKSPPPRLSCVALTGDGDPRISSANLGADDEISIDCEQELGSRNMRRWLQYQQWMAMVARAENNLSELSSMLQYAVKSMADSREMDFFVEEMQQRQSSIYYAS